MKKQLERLLHYLILHKDKKHVTGLCVGVFWITNSSDEKTKLMTYLKANRPTKDLHPQFFDEVHCLECKHEESSVLWILKSSYPTFWWPIDNIDVRIEFVKYLITLQ